MRIHTYTLYVYIHIYIYSYVYNMLKRGASHLTVTNDSLRECLQDFRNNCAEIYGLRATLPAA